MAAQASLYEKRRQHREARLPAARLALATRQHFASKGGYIVHFDGAQGTVLVADTPWTVP